jgi:hypothetical protein
MITKQLKTLTPALLLVTMTLTGCGTDDEMHFPAAEWEYYNSPEEAGFSSERLAEIRQSNEELDTDVIMIVHRGKVVLVIAGTTLTVVLIGAARRAVRQRRERRAAARQGGVRPPS